jgi:hypothetical protein
MQVLVKRVDAIRPHGDNLSIVTVGEHEVVANRKEDGSFRFEPNELVIYVPENAIVPDKHLQERGYWDDAKKKGLLGGSKGNRVKMQRFAGHESRGLVWKLTQENGCAWANNGRHDLLVEEGEDLTGFFGITEYVPQ